MFTAVIQVLIKTIKYYKNNTSKYYSDSFFYGIPLYLELKDFKITMFSTGSKNLDELRTAKLLNERDRIEG